MPSEISREQLVELRERVRSLSAPDRNFDRRLFAVLLGPYVCENKAFYKPLTLTSVQPVEFTGSIDAALSLVERVLPGWNLYRIDGWHDGGRPCGYGVELRRKDNSAAAQGGWLECSMPLAILDALLSALLEQDSASNGGR